MEQINHHIKTLLSAHDCVIIPNFGAFIADYSPAVVSEDSSTIPGKAILFNRNLTRNDGLLINAIIEETGLDYPKAKEEIESYVAKVNQRLRKGEKILFDGVGVLQLDEAGFVQFIADDNNTCLLDSYGLKPIRLRKIKTRDLPPVAIPEPEGFNTKRTYRVIMRVASVAAVVALILIFATPLTDMSLVDYAALDFDKSTPEEVMNSTVVTSSNADVVSENDEVKTSLPQDNANLTSSPLSCKTPEKDLAEGAVVAVKYYHIIIASLATESKAEQYVHTFKSKYNFDSVEMLQGTGRYRISVAHFDQKNEAIAFVKSLRLLNPKFSDAWVLPQTSN